jgi:YVTN family beta-propeller protein
MVRLGTFTRNFGHYNRLVRFSTQLQRLLFVLCIALAGDGVGASLSWSHSDILQPAPLPEPACPEPLAAAAWPPRYLNFETPQCNAITLSRRGRLYLINTPGHEIIEMTRSGKIKRRLPVGLEPSGVAASPDGRTLYVTNHLSDSISVVDVKKWQVKATIEQIDPDNRLAILDEPCGVAFSPTEAKAFVTLSQPNRVAVIDTTTHSVTDLVDIPGEDPRALRVSRDGRHVFVAAFASGNQTEVEVAGEETLYEAAGNWWQGFLNSMRAALGNTGLTGRISTPAAGANLAQRPDKDIFIMNTATLEITSIDDVGTLLYDIEVSPDGNTLWVASTNHENFKNGFAEINGQPIANRLTRIHPGTFGWDDAEITTFATDEDPLTGEPIAGGAVPSSMAWAKHQELLVTATSSDTLVVFDENGSVRKRIPVGSMPRGVATRGNLAWTYNRGDSSVSIINLKKGVEKKRVSFAEDPAPATIEAGRRHFYSASLSGTGTFSCASCHPDADTDHLIWEFDEVTGHRGTQTVRGIQGTEGFHWDGSQTDARELILGGVGGPIFQGTIDPCAADQMAQFILNVPFPPSPHRAPSDMLSAEARVGAAVARRGIHYDHQDDPVQPLHFDPGFAELLKSIAGENLLPTAVEGCAAGACHASPLWTSQGQVNGIEAVTFRGMWDRNSWTHSGISSKAGSLEASDLYRLEHGHLPRYQDISSAAASSSSFMTTFFRFHDNPQAQPGVDPLALNNHIEEFLRELSTGLPGVLGRQVLLDGTPTPQEDASLTEILTAADSGKITMRIHGTTTSGQVHWRLVPGTAPTFITEGGDVLTLEDVRAILEDGPYLLLVTADLPTNTGHQPLLRTVVTLDTPNLIATAINGISQTFEFRGSGFVPGMRLLVDGFPYVELEVISDTVARHTESHLNAAGPFYILSLLNPNGLQSNEFPMPILGEPDLLLPFDFAMSPDSPDGLDGGPLVSAQDQ